ncbi:tandem large repeat [Vibrio harveyi]|uniref:tandem large repeat n=1 Tax=Vibrio harveyi TaxID=669 RepID=UPI003CED0700
MAASLLLSACGGGGGGDSTPPARKTGSISGNVFDAPVNGAKIEVFEYKNGKVGRLLANTTSNAFGDYKLEFESSSMPLYVVAQQGSYTDPLTKEIVSSSAGKTLRLEGVVNFSEGSNQTLMLTPLTNIVSGLAKYKIAEGASGADAISKALSSINGMYGFNVNETTPIDITKGGQSSFATPGHQYGALLTAYSSYSYDLIEKYGQSKDNIYTSMHLADIQFRDVIADGLLDGLEISESTGAVTPLTFGQQKVTSDVYTQDLSQQILIVVNDPKLNVSGTDADDYVAFSQQVNDLGTHGQADGVIPPRDETEIDTIPPTVTRTDSDVLAGTDNVDLRINDDIGVQSISAYVEYKLNGIWSGEFKCSDQQTSGSEFCSVDASGFEVGVRETNIKVSIDTNAIDAVERDSDTGLSNVSDARLVFYTADVLGNELVPGSDKGHYVNFYWDNEAPVITVSSASAINKQLPEYVLKGTVKEASQDIKSVNVSFKNGLPEELSCTPVITESGSACEFTSKPYSTEEFLSTTTFDITAKDTKDNVGKLTFTVSRDDQAPAQIVAYPEGASMNYVNVNLDGERSTYEGVYTQDTYTSDNVQSSRDYLKIDYVYASSGLKSLDGVDFANFNVNLLKEKKIPYVKVRVSDVSSDTVLGTSADKLKLVVKYYVSPNNDGQYAFQERTQTVASTEDVTANIPHETIMDSNGRVSEVIYYVPFVREILGEGFKNVSENASQKLEIQTIDESENVSAAQVVYFRSSFDLPTMTVVTPFIGARVQLEGLNPNGEFTSLASCTTIQQPESDQTTALDVAVCETTTDVVNYEFMRVRLIGVEGTDPHYYQWKDDEGKKASVNLNNANIGAYFELDGSNTYYITELATYQTGLFDYRWNQVEAGDKTSERASQILTDVKYALSGANSNNSSFFGFDPTVTAYATNEMLEKPIPNVLTNDYLHRFLVEAIDGLAQNLPRNNSSDFASAIYDDLSYDGKANGLGAGGNKIKLDDYEFSSDTYRKDLAQSYYNIMTGKYQIPDNIAQLYADDISQANPKLGNDSIFDSEGGSIDVYPPEKTLKIVTGRQTMVGNKRYVAGEVVSQVVLEDPSGIVEKGDNAPKFKSMWYAGSNPNTAIPLDLNIEESGESGKFKKEYFFTLNSESSDLKDIIEFALEISAFDTKGNGYSESNPHVERLYVDNDYPKASYEPPKDINDEEIKDGVYLSVKNNIHDLTFILDDVVGDKLDKRSLLLYKSSGEKYPVSYEQFYKNETKRFVVRLCSQKDCSGQGVTINPGDGNWFAVASAEDNLGNAVSDADSGAPRFRIYIDSEAPVVNDANIAERLGGNSVWTPIIDWGELSQGSNVKIELSKGSGQTQTLEACDPVASSCDEPYLVGEQPDIKVQLVANAFSYDATNEFYVTATDKAYPKNESRKGTFTFKVDNEGPTILLSTPWVEDALTKENAVVGRNFNVLFDGVTDDSKITEVSLFQVGQADALKTFKPAEPSQKFPMPLVESDTDKIDMPGEGNSVSLYVKAKDIHGFESQSNTNSVIFDNQGPDFNLVGHDESSYYVNDYVFELRAVDLGASGNVSVEGVDRENLEFWIFEDAEPPFGTQGTDIVNAETLKVPLGGLSDGEHTIRIKGLDVRGNSSQKDFRFNVSNKVPQLDLKITNIANGETIDRVVYDEGDIKLTLKVTDVSGVKNIVSTYKYSGESKATDFQFDEVVGEEGTWTATLKESELKADGNYELSISVYNNVQHNSDDNPLVSKINHTLSVQRNGVALDVLKPTQDFQNYVSNGVLDVTFTTLSEVKAQQIQCWVRQEYDGNEAPDENEKPTSGKKNISPGQEPSCTVDSESTSLSPAILIVQTKGTNGAVAVQKFDFKMMDSDSPVVTQPATDTYQFSGGEVTHNPGDDTKFLAFELMFKDELSGVNITNEDNYPKIIRKAGAIPFSAESCVLNADGQVVCRYKEKYSDIIQKTAVTHDYKVTNIKDNAGNLALDHEFEFLLPTEDPIVEIISPSEGNVLNGKTLDVEFRVKLSKNSELENVEVTFGDESYNLKTDDNFEKFKPCGVDGEYRCSIFHSDQLESSLENKALTVNVTATDVWDNRGSAAVKDIRFDNTAPIIGDVVTVSEQPNDKVRFTFDEMRDEVSGLATVKYTVRVLNFEEEKTENVTYFELPKDQIAGRDEIRVEVIATDAVENFESATKTVYLKAPTVTLAFDGIAGLQGNKLAFVDENQSFTITSKDSEHVKASSYSVDMTPKVGDTLNFKGNITSSTASGTMVFDADDQAEYTYKVTVIDSIGRSITDFELFDKSYDAKGLDSVVDHEIPVITGVRADQVSMTPTGDKYNLDVTAYVSDKNLSSVTSTADNGAGVIVGPQSITQPANDSDPYVMHYLLSKGDYTIKVVASDLVNHKAEETITPTVEAASVPELTISSSGSAPLAGGVEVQLTFKFTEDVKNFEFSDVKLEASDGSDIGELKLLSWNKTDDKTWTVNYLTPERADKDITIRVDDGSYESVNTIPGIGDSLLLGVEGVLPTLTKVTFDPIHQEIGKSVNIQLEFDKELQEATASLGSNNVTSLAVTANKKVWTGTVEVPNVPEASVGLVVSQYKDLVGNVGENNASNALPITPTLTVENIRDVNSTDAATVAVNGGSTRFVTTDILTIKAVDTDGKEVTKTTTANALGQWNTSLDVTSLKDGTITVTVNGTNDLKAVAKEVSTTFTLTQTKPTVDDSQTTISPQYAAAGETVTVTATFDKEVTTPTGSTLGTAAINWTPQVGAHTQWEGLVQVAAVADSVKSVELTLQGFEDATGNAGEPFTLSKALAMTPTLTVENIRDVNSTGAATVAVSGGSTRFETTDTLTIKAVDTDGKEVTKTTTANALGQWSTSLDVTSLKDGTITVTVNGTNDLKAVAKEVSTTFTLTQTKPTVDDSQTTISPQYAAAGEIVTVTATFDKEVMTPTGSTLGTAAINWTPQVGTHTQWVGSAQVAAVADSVKSVELTLQGFEDATGNAGESFTSSKVLAITPTLTVENIRDVNSTDAATVAINGGSTRFETTDTLTIKAVDTDGKEVTKTTTANALGQWNTSLDVTSLKDGSITVTVNGTNDLKAVAKEVSTTFTLTQTKPTVDDSQTTISPQYAAAGEIVTVTATFDKEVMTPTGSTLGTAAINWTPQVGTHTQWVGSVQVAAVADSVKSVSLTLQGFEDATGNAGESFTSSKALAITPTITLETINDVSGATTVTVNGASTRFEVDDTIEIKAVDSAGVEVTGNTLVLVGGAWTIDLDLSTLKDGVITVSAKGTNALSATADEESTTFNYDSTTALVIPKSWDKHHGDIPLLNAA